MSYLSRAQSFVERGEIMRAFYQLVNGLRRNPHDERALDLLVDLYIGDFDSPGVEKDLLVVLGVVPQGIDIYEMIYASLEQSGDERRLKSLVQTRERENLLPPEPEATHIDAQGSTDPYAHPADPATEHHGVPGPRQAQFVQAPLDTSTRDDGQWRMTPHHDAPNHHAGDHEVLAYDLDHPNLPIDSADPTIHSAPTKILEAVTAPQPAVETIDGRRVKIKANEMNYSDASAMDGVFSSIDTYLDEDHQELRQELADRSKKRFLWIGFAILVIIAILIFAYPSKETPSTSSDSVDESSSEIENVEDIPKIEKPIGEDSIE